jgi:hypothetical protein
MYQRAPFVNAAERRKRLASSALIHAFTEELIRHGSDDLPKFRRVREIARQVRLLNRSSARVVARDKALLLTPEEAS